MENAVREVGKMGDMSSESEIFFWVKGRKGVF